ncbi:MAG: L-fucose isomerase [Bacillota bacterium]|nr:L-fucose isomerase [Bacillota bacterium]
MSHQMNEPQKRLIGRMPKIGIRPVIDGRRKGVRESMEAKTRAMAEAAAQLITSRLRYSNGLPVEVVIASPSIGGAAEAAMAADFFAAENVTATLSVTPCWCYGSETMDLDPLTTKAVWGFNGTERPGAVYLAAVMAAHAQRGLPAFAIYGRDVQDIEDNSIPADVEEKILRWARAAMAVGQMRGKSYASIGSSCMGIAGSFPQPMMYQNYFGIRWESLDQIEIERRIARGIYDHEEYERAAAWVKEWCPQGFDKNIEDYADNPEIEPFGEEEFAEQWKRSILGMMIMRDILIGNRKLAEMGFAEEAAGRNAILGGVQGQRQWTDHFANHDFAEAMLNSSFDWNGIREPFIFATENDNNNALAMLFTHLLNNRASVFADVRTYWSPDAIERVTGWRPEGKAAGGVIHLINSGAASLDGTGQAVDADGTHLMKEWWELTSDDVAACLNATKWCPADLSNFRGGGFSSSFETAYEMPVTMVRLNVIDGVGPMLQIAEGDAVLLPEEVSLALQKRTDRTWPTTWFAPRVTGEGAFRDAYSVMANWGANHGAFTYGHVGCDLITLASMLRIPVVMHNVPEERIYRPHSWTAFGTACAEAADLRACETYGPLYGRTRV